MTTRPQSDKHSTNLDLFRSVAVLLVLVDHLLTYFGVTSIGRYTAYELGHLGVLLFFVHTSLVLMWSLQRLRAERQSGMTFVPFMIQRCFRVLPLSMFVVAVIYAFNLPFGFLKPHKFSAAPVSTPGFLANLFLVQNLVPAPNILGPLWSLPLEMQMYLLLPAIFIVARREKAAVKVFLLWLVSIGLALAQHSFASSSRLDVFWYAPNFFSGVLAYTLYGSSKKVRAWIWPCFLALAVMAYMFASHYEAEAGWMVCFGIGIGLPHFKELTQRSVVSIAHQIAKYSYGIYLCHFSCIWLAFVICKGQPIGVQWLILLASLAAIPIALYHSIEGPMIRLGHRLARKDDGPEPLVKSAFTS